MFHDNPDDRPDYFLADDSDNDTENTSAGKSRTIDFLPENDKQPSTGNSSGIKPPRSRFRRVLAWTVATGVIVLCAAFYLRYCSPYAVDAAERVYVINVDKRGLIFKTYEAQVIPASAIADTTRVYSTPQQFSVASSEVATQLQKIQGTAIPVTLHYETYHATLPWRGASRNVVTSATTP